MAAKKENNTSQGLLSEQARCAVMDLTEKECEMVLRMLLWQVKEVENICALIR